MLYVVAVTNLHLQLGKIVSECSGNAVLVDLRRSGDLPNFMYALRSYVSGVVALFKVLLDRDAHVVVAHPFNIWCSLFVLFAQTVSVLDDGVAYYNNTLTPSSWRARIYFFLSKKFFECKEGRLGVIGYYDVLKTADIHSYYCLCPEFFWPNERLSNTVKLRLPATSGSTKKRDVFVFLDSTSVSMVGYDCESIFNYLASRFSVGSDDFYFKPHPAEVGVISKWLEGCSWAKCISGSFEEFSDEYELAGVYSFFSSASLYIKLKSSTVSIYCFDNDAPELQRVRRLMDLLDAQIINV